MKSKKDWLSETLICPRAPAPGHNYKPSDCPKCYEEWVGRIQADAVKDIEEYEDKVPMMLRILSKVEKFGGFQDAALARQLIGFFKSWKNSKEVDMECKKCGHKIVDGICSNEWCMPMPTEDSKPSK